MCFLELFLSTYLALAPIKDLKQEIKNNLGDGLSALLALILMCVTVPILLHMSYIISTYTRYLDDFDIRRSFGHYYVDLNTRSGVPSSIYHVVFIFRRIVEICNIMFMKGYPQYQLMIHILITLSMVGYIAHSKPFLISKYNINEACNEYTTMLLGFFQMSFVNAGNGPDARHINGLVYIFISLLLLTSNLFFIFHCSFYENYDLYKRYIVWRMDLYREIRSIKDSMKFKNDVGEKDVDAFMLDFEVKDEAKRMKLLIEATKFFSEKMFRKKDIEWMSRNKFTETQIQVIYPNYKKVIAKDLYMPALSNA